MKKTDREDAASFVVSPETEQLYRVLRESTISDYERWTAYRERMTALVLSLCEPGESLAIFGAGQCADLDLLQLSAYFSRIELYDINAEAMEKALQRCREATAAGVGKDTTAECVHGCTNVRSHVIDLAGIPEEAYLRFAEGVRLCVEHLCAGSWDAEEAKRYIDVVIEQIYREAAQSALPTVIPCDCSLALGLFSQLNVLMAKILELGCSVWGSELQCMAGRNYDHSERRERRRIICEDVGKDEDCAFQSCVSQFTQHVKRSISAGTGTITDRAAALLLASAKKRSLWGLDVAIADGVPRALRYEEFFDGSRQAYACLAKACPEEYPPEPVYIDVWPFTAEKEYVVLNFAIPTNSEDGIGSNPGTMPESGTKSNLGTMPESGTKSNLGTMPENETRSNSEVPPETGARSNNSATQKTDVRGYPEVNTEI